MSKQVIVNAGAVMAPIPVSPETPTIGEYWCHSITKGLPEMGWEAFVALMSEQHGLTVLYRSMQDDPDVMEGVDLELESWNPKNPFASDKAFMLVLGEDEDGPFAVWGLPK